MKMEGRRVDPPPFFMRPYELRAPKRRVEGRPFIQTGEMRQAPNLERVAPIQAEQGPRPRRSFYQGLEIMYTERGCHDQA